MSTSGPSANLVRLPALGAGDPGSNPGGLIGCPRAIIMAKKSGLKSAKRFGTRYGPSKKLKLALIETEQRKLQLCPACGKHKAKWKSVGIFECKKCSTKFTGKAYAVAKVIQFKKEQEAPKIEAVVEE